DPRGASRGVARRIEGAQRSGAVAGPREVRDVGLADAGSGSRGGRGDPSWVLGRPLRVGLVALDVRGRRGAVAFHGGLERAHVGVEETLELLAEERALALHAVEVGPGAVDLGVELGEPADTDPFG